MIYVLMSVILNSSDTSQNELEQNLVNSLPSAYPSLDFQFIQPSTVHIIDDADLFLIPSDSKLLLNSIFQAIEYKQVPTLILGDGNSKGKLFYSEPPRNFYFQALNVLVKSQKMKKIGFIYSANQLNIEALEFLRSQDHIIVSASLNKYSSQEKVSELLSRFYKKQGITDFIVLTTPNLCEKIENGFLKLKINKKWNIAIYGKECIGNVGKVGSIVIVPEGLENVNSFHDYSFWSASKSLDLLNGKNLQSEQIERIFQGQNFFFSIVNVQEKKSVIVGRVIYDEIEIISDIIYPSGDNYREIVSKVPIRLSANTGIVNPPGYPNSYQNAKYHQGTYFMLEKVRKTNENFANFDLQLFDNITCGVSYFDYNYSRDCYLKIKDELGIAHIPSFYDSTVQTLHQFKDLGINIPVISGMGNNFIGSDISVFSNFFRLVSPSKYCTYQDMFLMKKHDWTELIVFYSDDSWGQHHYNYFLYFESIGYIKMVNAEKFRKIPIGYKPDMLDDYRGHIKDALDSGCNIMMLAMSDPASFFFIESLAEYGVEFGEFMIFFRTPNAQDAGTSEDANFELRKKLLHGTYFGYDSFWEGDYGAEIRAEYEKSEYTSYLPGFYIDTVLTITNTLEHMLYMGKDYEDTESFIGALAKIRFVGVTGRVSFEETTHTRNRYACNTYNVYYDDNLEKYVMNWVIKVDPLSKVYFTTIGKEVWYKSTIYYPNSKSDYHNCPYFTENIVNSKISATPEFIINLIILIFSTVISLFFFLKLKLEETKSLSKVFFIKIIDVIQMVIIVVEPLQLITIGPSFRNITRLLTKIISLLSLNIMKFYSLRDMSYWIFYSITIGVSYIWIILCVLSLNIFYKVLRANQSGIIYIKNLLAPLIINYLFIPILYLASSINSCKKTERRHLDIAFLDYDCNFQCWNSEHITLIVISTVLIVTLSPMAVTYRVILQNTGENVKVKSNGKFLLFKNLISLLVISHGGIIQDRSEIGFAIFFLILMVGLFVFTLKWMPYNYDRINLWTKVVLACVIWHSIICIADLKMETNENFLAAVYFSGWIFILLIGSSLHSRLPASLLVFKKGRTILQMISLAFKFGYFENVNPYITRRLRFLRGGRRFK